MTQHLLLHILAGIGGLWIAIQYIPNVEFEGPPQTLLIAGLVLGIMNAILKPILNIATFPIRILTLGLSSFLISLLIVWALELIISELNFMGFAPLLWTTLVIWGVTIPLSLLSKGKV